MEFEGPKPPTYRNVMQMPVAETAPVGIIQDINADIMASLEIVRRLRMEIMRLDNDVKSSQIGLNVQRADDTRSKAEIETLIMQWRSEKETLVREIQRLQDLVVVAERNARTSEASLEDLRFKATELSKKSAEKDSELEVARKKKARLQEQIAEFQKKIEATGDKSKMIVVLEEKIDGYSKRQAVEADTSARLQKELFSLQKQHQSLLEESTEVSLRVQQKKEASTEAMARKTAAVSNEAENNQLTASLWKDLALFETLQAQMEGCIRDVRSVETTAVSTAQTVTTTTTTRTFIKK